MKLMMTLTVCCLLLAISQAQAGVFTLSDGNSNASFATNQADADNANVELGQYEWEVDGTSHLYQQWFWFRVGGGPEVQLDALPIISEGVTDTTLDTLPDTLTVIYGDARLEIKVSMRLQGGAAGSDFSDIAEQIKITNLSDQAMDIAFFQYVDLDMAGTFNNDTAQIIAGQVAQQVDNGSGMVANESVVTPMPSHYQVDLWEQNTPPDHPYLALNDADTDDLTDDAGPVSGDCVWAFQWDFNIDPNLSVQISKDKQIKPIPEPATVALIGLGSLLMFRRRK